jgi:ribonucleoside-diphosphate reductase alpha chain
MQLATPNPVPDSSAKFAVEEAPDAMQTRYSEYKIIRRNGAVVGFEPSKIAIALTKAFIAVNGGQGAASARVREMVTKLTELVVAAAAQRGHVSY